MRTLAWLGGFAAVLAAAGIAWAATGRERSSAVYPPQKIPIVFSHAVHIKAGADCATCHDSARKSEKAADRLLPGSNPKDPHAECSDCHDIGKQRADPASACETCHLRFDQTVQKTPERVEFPAPNLIFPHKLHIDRKIECASCHGPMKNVGLATRYQLPKMETCLICHEDTFAPMACKTCHPTQPSGRLQMVFLSGLLRPMQGNPLGMDHGPRFEFNHASRASVGRDTCLECHAFQECQACHDSLQKPLSVHPNDYITLHPVQARQDSAKCDSCHRMQSFCAACHERAGVGMHADRSFRPRNVKVHPDYFTFVVDRANPRHHAIQASRDIKQCMACHREETCLPCHSERDKFGTRDVINPHPEGFQGICKALAGKNDRACLKCHTEDSLAARGCR